MGCAPSAGEPLVRDGITLPRMLLIRCRAHIAPDLEACRHLPQRNRLAHVLGVATPKVRSFAVKPSIRSSHRRCPRRRCAIWPIAVRSKAASRRALAFYNAISPEAQDQAIGRRSPGQADILCARHRVGEHARKHHLPFRADSAGSARRPRALADSRDNSALAARTTAVMKFVAPTGARSVWSLASTHAGWRLGLGLHSIPRHARCW